MSVSVGKVIAASAIAAVLTLLALVYCLGMRPIDAFYVAFTIGSATAAAVALSAREANIGTVASAAALLIVLGLLGPYLGLSSAFVFKGQTYTIEVPVEYVPWIMIGIIGIFAIGYAAGANVGRLGLWTLGAMLSFFWFTVTDAAAQVLLACIVGVIAAIPLLSEKPSRGSPMLLAALAAPVPAARTEITFDLSQVNYFGMLITPILLFLALDPFNVIENRAVRELSSVAVLILVFIQVLSVVMA